MRILFHLLHICSWRYNICSPNQPSLKCHRNQDTMTTTVTMYLKGYFNDCTNPGEKVTNSGKDQFGDVRTGVFSSPYQHDRCGFL